MSRDSEPERYFFTREVERIQTLIRALEDESTPAGALIMAQAALGTAANRLEALLPEDESQGWPRPTADQPSIYDLWDWDDEYGGSEATDGCWVDAEGVCKHGYPSWLIQLELT
jgi:hypothetical protein